MKRSGNEWKKLWSVKKERNKKKWKAIKRKMERSGKEWKGVERSSM